MSNPSRFAADGPWRRACVVLARYPRGLSEADEGMNDVMLVLGAPFPFPQGGQVLVVGQARALAAAGVRVRLAAYDGVGAWPDGIGRVPVLSAGAVPQRSGPSWRKVAWDASLVAGVVRALRADPPEAIVAHHVEGLAVALAARRLSGVAVPVAWMPHTALDEELPSYLPARLDGTRAARAAAAAGGWVDDALARRPDAVLPLSARGVAWARGHGARVVVRVPPGVDADELAGGDGPAFRRRHGLAPGEALVLYTGNADRYQDVPDAVAACARVPGVRLVLLTHGPAVAMRARAAEGGPLGHVVVVGEASVDTLRDALAAADVGIVPRRVCAGFPMKLLHHLAAGHPVVVPRALAEPVEGVIPAGPGGPDALAGPLAGLVRDREGARRLGQAAARSVRARWSWARHAHTLRDALRGLL